MDDKTINTMMSSGNDSWGTPQELYFRLEYLFGIDLDVCANKDNAKTPNYFDKKKNGLKKKWYGSCFMNPPYSKPNKKENKPGLTHWIDKAIKESKKKRVNVVVTLLPARTETKWFKKVWDNASLILFLEGRLKFEGADSSAPFPSVIAIFGKKKFSKKVFRKLGALGTVVYKDKKWRRKNIKKKKN
jgi:site-specific DNA-methyltransferase (adenine-specific)